MEAWSGSCFRSCSACCCSEEPRPDSPELTICSGVIVRSLCCKLDFLKVLVIEILVSVRFVHVGLWGLLGSYVEGQFLIFVTSLASGGAMCGIVVVAMWSW
jgi:hypothetical protein